MIVAEVVVPIFVVISDILSASDLGQYLYDNHCHWQFTKTNFGTIIVQFIFDFVFHFIISVVKVSCLRRVVQVKHLFYPYLVSVIYFGLGKWTGWAILSSC